jgi:hypothetical protein
VADANLLLTYVSSYEDLWCTHFTRNSYTAVFMPWLEASRPRHVGRSVGWSSKQVLL